MIDYDDTVERERFLMDSVEELQKVNEKIAKLQIRKEELVNQIVHTIGHNKDGQTKYTVGHYNVTVKTNFIYGFDKRAYLSGQVYLPDEFNPIKEEITYKVDKKSFLEAQRLAPISVRNTLEDLVTIKPGKASVTITF